MKQSNKEKRGIYNVSFNEKKSTPIDTDLETIENAIIDYVVYYVKGYHSNRNDRGLGAEHIKLHLEPNSEGEISLEELLNLGNSIREYLKNFKEPFIDEKGAKIYEWENKEKIRFRVIADTIRKSKREGDNCHSTPFTNAIITFYSDRNLNERMEFKNPNVAKYYASREYTKDNKETNRLLTAHSKTESNQRLAEMDRRGRPYHSIFNDFNFRKSANSAINSHDSTKTNTLTTQGSNATSIANESIAQINAHNDEKEQFHLSLILPSVCTKIYKKI